MASHPDEDLAERSPIGELTTSCDGQVRWANRTLLRWLGMEREAVQGGPMSALLTPGSQLYYETQYRAVLQLHARVEGVALELRTAHGTDFPVVLAAERHEEADGEAVVHVSLFPAGARAAYELELRQSRGRALRAEARLRLLHDLREALRSALQPTDVAETLAQGLITHTHGGLVTIWLVQADGTLALAHGTPTAFSPATTSPDADLPVAAAARTARPLSLRAEEVRRRWPALARPLIEAGREGLLLAPLLAEGDVLGVVQVAVRRNRVVAPDELELLATLGVEAGEALVRCELPAHLQGLPLRDALTGTATPALFGERVGCALARAADSEQPLAVLLLDLVPGPFAAAAAQQVPDDLVAEVGKRLLGAADSVARVGRQRFALLREHCPPAEAHLWAQLLQNALEQEGPEHGQVALSIGGVVIEPAVDGRSVSVGDVLGWAGDALGIAAARGPGRVVVHAAAQRQAARALVHTERTVRRALHDDGVVMHYQPVVHLQTGQVIGVEALCRLRLPDGTLLQPAHFIDAAEDSGLLIPLGQRALVAACRQQAVWASHGDDLDVSVNVAASQAADPEFAPGVLDVLRATDCAPRHLVLELTESALLAATTPTLDSFAVLREAGVRIALDDFGTRYASLDYVRSFPLDELKIDQSFVAGLPSSRVARAIVRMVAQLAAELDLVCVAEGIETPAQARFLSELGVLGQGFAVGHPVPREDVVPWLTPASWLVGHPRVPSD